MQKILFEASCYLNDSRHDVAIFRTGDCMPFLFVIEKDGEHLIEGKTDTYRESFEAVAKFLKR